MLGFATLGKFALGQVGSPSVIVPGVSATGVAGVISASEGAVPPGWHSKTRANCTISGRSLFHHARPEPRSSRSRASRRRIAS